MFLLAGPLAPAFLQKYNIDHLVFSGRSFIELPKIELPEELWMQLVLLLRDQCTCASGIFREVASGNDLKKFLYVPISTPWTLLLLVNSISTPTSSYDNYAHLQAIFVLWIVSIVGRWFSLLTLVYLSKFSIHFHFVQWLGWCVACFLCPEWFTKITNFSFFGQYLSCCWQYPFSMRSMKIKYMPMEKWL